MAKAGRFVVNSSQPRFKQHNWVTMRLDQIGNTCIMKGLALLAAALIARAQSSLPNGMSTLPQQSMVSGTCMASEPQPECGLHQFPLTCPQLLEAYKWDPKSTCCSFSDTDSGGCLVTVGGSGSFCTWTELDNDVSFTASILEGSDSECPKSSYQLPTQQSSSNVSTNSSYSGQGEPAQAPAPAPAPTKVTGSTSSYTTTTESGACWASEPTSDCGLYHWPSTCTDVLQAYKWSGTCCSFVDTNDGGCTLTVDGPGTECTWSSDGNEYTTYIDKSNQNSCPPTKYTVDSGTKSWDGPTPTPQVKSGSCWTVVPSEECGFTTWSTPCSELATSLQWEGSCCSLSDTQDGGCLLSVDGPGSDCTYNDGTTEYTTFVSKANEGSCPESIYSVTDNQETSITFGPTPEPVTTGTCTTSFPDESCGIVTFNNSCPTVVSRFEWSGSCCSLNSTSSGGCQLTVDGPGSTCSWSEIGRKSYYSVTIDQTNDGSCPSSSFTAISRRSPFTNCMYNSFSQCLSTCESYPSLRQTFKTCYQQDQTQALQCAAGAIAVCGSEAGNAPSYICDIISTMYSIGAMQSDLCLELKEKCTKYGISDSACT